MSKDKHFKLYNFQITIIKNIITILIIIDTEFLVSKNLNGCSGVQWPLSAALLMLLYTSSS